MDDIVTLRIGWRRFLPRWAPSLCALLAVTLLASWCAQEVWDAKAAEGSERHARELLMHPDPLIGRQAAFRVFAEVDASIRKLRAASEGDGVVAQQARIYLSKIERLAGE